MNLVNTTEVSFYLILLRSSYPNHDYNGGNYYYSGISVLSERNILRARISSTIKKINLK